jgi:hypothetical protein
VIGIKCAGRNIFNTYVASRRGSVKKRNTETAILCLAALEDDGLGQPFSQQSRSNALDAGTLSSLSKTMSIIQTNSVIKAVKDEKIAKMTEKTADIVVAVAADL